MTDEFRVVMRAMIGPGSERTLIPALLPPSPAHIHTLVTVGVRNSKDMLHIFATLLSIVTDMMVKISGKGFLSSEFIGYYSTTNVAVCIHSTRTRTLMLDFRLSETLERTNF